MKELFDTEEIFGETNIWCKSYNEWMPLNKSPLRDSIMDTTHSKSMENKAGQPPPPPPKPKQPRPPSLKRPSLKSQPLPPDVKETDHLHRSSVRKVSSIASLKRASRRLSRKNPSQCYIEEFEPGALIWVEDPVLVWKLCQVISQNNSSIKVEVIEESKTETVDINFQDTFRHNPNIVADMTSLHYLHEASILYNLGVRAAERHPYTYMGSVLIAVNPLQQIPMPDMTIYNDATSIRSMPPHPYAIAGMYLRKFESETASSDSSVASYCSHLRATIKFQHRTKPVSSYLRRIRRRKN